MNALIGAEWLKLRKRWLTWILLALWFVVILLILVVPWLLALAVKGQTREDLYQVLVSATTLPGSLPWILTLGQGFAAWLAIVLVGANIGPEFGWGTIRPLLVRGVGRWQLLVAKLGVFALAIGVGLLLTTLFGVLLSLLAAVTLGEPVWRLPVSGSFTWDVCLMLARTFLSLAAYGLLAFGCAWLTQSTVAGLALPLGYSLLEGPASAGLLLLPDNWSRLRELLLGVNVGQLMNLNSHALPNAEPLTSNPAPLQALVAVLIYVLVFALVPFWVFPRRDIGGGG